MVNEEIEYFKRFSACYLLWAFSNFDRIVSDAVKRQERFRAEELEYERLNTPGMKRMSKLFSVSNDYAKRAVEDLMQPNPLLARLLAGTQWGGLKIGTTLKIRLPDDYKMPADPRPFWKKRLTGTLKLFRS